jgi:hypothetical protein
MVVAAEWELTAPDAMRKNQCESTSISRVMRARVLFGSHFEKSPRRALVILRASEHYRGDFNGHDCRQTLIHGKTSRLFICLRSV